MKSKIESIYPQNMTDFINSNIQNNSNKKYFSRNSSNDDNNSNNNDYSINHYVSKSFNSLDKYQKGNSIKEEYNPKISNQFNDKNFTNNIINYCLINQNHIPNEQNQSNNFLYNLKNDLLFNKDEKPYPKPEPIPLKIDKTTKYINISKNFDINNKNINNIENDVDIRLITFLHKMNLDYLANTFKNNYVNFQDLFLLNKDDLIEMKIPIGPRNKLIYYIEQYKKTMKNYELEDISYFFSYNNGQNIDMISSTMPSSYNNDISNKLKENSNFLLASNSETKRGYNFHYNIGNENNDINIINNKNKLDTSFKGNNPDKSRKNSINKNISKIEKRNNFNMYDLKRSKNISDFNKFEKKNNSIITSKKMKKIEQKKNYHKSGSFIFSYNFNNKINKNNKNKINHNNNFLKVQDFNKKKSTKNNKYYFRNSLSNFFENISLNKSDNKNNNKQKLNLKTSKITNHSNDSFLINNKNNNIKKNKNIKRNKSMEIKENFNEKNLLENFKSLNSEVEKFENKYKRLKKNSCERKKKIKQLLMGNRISEGKIQLLKKQLNNINNTKPQEFDYVNKNNINIIKESHNNSQYRNYNINKNINNSQNRSETTLIYELNIDNI